MPFTFLQNVLVQFKASYSQAEVEDAPSLASFEPKLAQMMEQQQQQQEAGSSGSTAATTSKSAQVRGEIDAVKDVMVQNIERVLERGERIDLLVDKTDGMNQTAFAFRKRSTALRRRMWWRNTRLLVFLAFAVLFLVYLIVGAFCGLPCKL